jgi:hypothetical protein
MIAMDTPTGDEGLRLRGRPGRDADASAAAPGWRPLAGAALLDRLRVTGRARPPADPTTAVDLRTFLERGLDGSVGRAVDPAPVSGPVDVVTKDRLTRALSCPAHRSAGGFGDRLFTQPLACGALVDVLFRQLVTVGSIGDAMVDAMDGLALDERQAPLVAWIRELPRTERAELRAEVDRQADGLRRRWPALDPSWFPRTQEVLRAPLVDGRIELSARVDLAVGRPAEDVASVAVVEVKSGVRRPGHRLDLHFYALIETLRSTVPPFAVATYYSRTGELDVEPVTPELLVGAARRCLAGIRAMGPAAGDHGPSTADGYCAACLEHPLRTVAPVGGGAPVPLADVSDAGEAGTDTVVAFPRERAA